MRSLCIAAAFVALLVSATLGTPGAEAAPSAAVMIASSSDTSPGVLDAHARDQHGAIVRRTLRDVLRRAGAEVRLAGIAAHKLDVAVVAWRIIPAAHQTDVAVELRVVITDAHGKMLSILTGRARVSAPGPSQLGLVAELREQAIAEAIHGLTPSLQTQLARDVG